MVVPGELAKYLLFADRLFHSGTTRSDADTHRHTATAHHQGCAGYHCVILNVISHYCCDFVIFKQVLPLFQKQRNEFFFTLPRKIHFFLFLYQHYHHIHHIGAGTAGENVSPRLLKEVIGVITG